MGSRPSAPCKKLALHAHLVQKSFFVGFCPAMPPAGAAANAAKAGRKKVESVDDAYPVAYSAEVTASVLVHEKYSPGWTTGKALLEAELKNHFPDYLDLAVDKYYPGG